MVKKLRIIKKLGCTMYQKYVHSKVIGRTKCSGFWVKLRREEYLRLKRENMEESK